MRYLFVRSSEVTEGCEPESLDKGVSHTYVTVSQGMKGRMCVSLGPQ